MKHIAKWFLAIGIYNSVTLAQINFDLPEDSASFGLLISDYETSEFEEGTVLNVPICLPCDDAEFPLEVIFQSPVDFGWIQFNYTETGDTVFYGTIVWNGQGEIYFPDTFFPADSFGVENESATDPDTIVFRYWNGSTLEEDTLLQSGSDAYERIRPLNIVHQFAEYPYQIMAYLYTPSVGMTDWSVAKWIFFLYRNPEVIGVDDENQIPEIFKLQKPFPNPFNPSTTIRFSATPNQKTTLCIFDITGRLVEELVNGELVTGEHEIVWNAGNQPSGVYFVRLQSGNNIETQKVLLIK